MGVVLCPWSIGAIKAIGGCSWRDGAIATQANKTTYGTLSNGCPFLTRRLKLRVKQHRMNG